MAMAACEIRIGSIVSHPCARRSVLVCRQCSRPFCKRHGSKTKDTCGECDGTYFPPKAPIAIDLAEMFAFTETEVAAFDESVDRSLARLPYDS